ncbi:unnamed protein product [Ceratitis capitata]|uniref:(Mediterranean fruit fly) hypothetical protein n=1 Tax=Ceratitis capitata TaxID=7213 RepID=A0A811USP6_CERCA|nr:unnamed protein product [Ceratitis capitata]
MPKDQAAVRLNNRPKPTAQRSSKAQTNGPTEQQGPIQGPNKAARPKPRPNVAARPKPTAQQKQQGPAPTAQRTVRKKSSLRVCAFHQINYQ